MRRSMRVMAPGLVAPAFTAIFCVAAIAQEQARSPYVVSAKAGGVNAVSGSVTVTRKGADAAQDASTRDDLESGDRLTTGADGRVEVLLNPGSYLRLAENSELELTDASLDAPRLRLLRGSAVLEITGAGDSAAPVEVATPQTKVSVDRKGVYRVNALPTDSTVVLVRKGRALVGKTTVKDGKQITVDRSGAMNVAEFDKNAQDSFDLWSGQRAEALATANRKLSKSAVASAYSGYRNNPLGWRRGFGGFWVYDPFFHGHTFLPYYSGWSSPYGHGYRVGFGFPRYRAGFGFGGFGGHRHGGTRAIIHSGHGGHRGHLSSGHHSRGHHGGRRR